MTMTLLDSIRERAVPKLGALACAMTLAASGALLPLATASAAPVILANGVNVLSLDATNGNGYPLSVAYNPTFNQYYGGGGGFPGATGWVWDAAGNVISQTTPINVDIRGVFYNPNTGTINVQAYGSSSGVGNPTGGVFQMGLNGSGFYTGTNVNVVAAPMPGIADDQSVAAYDPDLDRYYSRLGNNVVRIADGTGASLGSVNLDLVTPGSNSLQYTTIGFDSFFDVFVDLDWANDRALVHALDGTYLGASQLPNFNFDQTYSLGYANGILFVGTGDGAYEGFKIFGAAAAVPEPISLALFGIGLAGLGLMRRRQAA